MKKDNLKRNLKDSIKWPIRLFNNILSQLKKDINWLANKYSSKYINNSKKALSNIED